MIFGLTRMRLSDDRGQTVIEYALALALTAVVFFLLLKGLTEDTGRHDKPKTAASRSAAGR